MMNHHVHKLQPPDVVLRKINVVNNSAHHFSSIQMNINLSLSSGYTKTIWCETSCKEDRKDRRSNSRVSYTTMCVDLAGWNDHNVEQSSGFEQKTILEFHKLVPQFFIISVTISLSRRILILGISQCFFAFT
jgi:hypothetical protein